jgi:CheY-like chemotaxis protein
MPACFLLLGLKILLVEDEYLVASDLADALGDLGARVIGPAGTVRDALSLIEKEERHLDAAVLDINLRDERIYPVADELQAAGVPFVFTTGYDAAVIPTAYAEIPRCPKPVNYRHLIQDLLQITASIKRAKF